MAIGDVLVGLGVALLDGALFGLAAVTAVHAPVRLANHEFGPVVYAGVFAAVATPTVPYAYYRFQRDKRYFPVIRRYLDVAVRYPSP